MVDVKGALVLTCLAVIFCINPSAHSTARRNNRRLYDSGNVNNNGNNDDNGNYVYEKSNDGSDNGYLNDFHRNDVIKSTIPENNYNYNNKDNDNNKSQGNNYVIVEVCPFNCVCIYRSHESTIGPKITNITCSNQAFTSVPKGIPKHVVHLDLSGNLIQELKISIDFSSLANLNFLNLSDNRLRVIENGFFYGMKSLKLLDLSNNHLTSLEAAFFTQNIIYNYNKNNNIGDNNNNENEMFNDGSISNEYKHIFDDEEEDDDNNDEETSSIQSSLEQLFLNRNRFRGIEGAFEGMTKLKKVNLDHNHLVEISQFTFKDATNLQLLSLSHNHLNSMHRNAFANNHKLTNLQLKHNPDLYHVSSINLSPCRHLNYLDLSGCQLTRLSGFLELPSSLKYLQLRRNRITEVDANTFPTVTDLNILLLDGNNISKIQDGVFSKMTFLQQLWLNDNFLTSFPVLLPVSLQRLLLDNNRIEHWPDNTFDVTNNSNNNHAEPQLKTLSISSNRLQQLNTKSLSTMHHLTSLDVSENLLMKLEAATFAHNSKLNILNFNKNPITHISSEVFSGVSTLESLSMSYVDAKAGVMEVHATFIEPLKTCLKYLELDYSPQVIETLVHGAVGSSEVGVDVGGSKSNINSNNKSKSRESFKLSDMEKLQELQMAGSRLESLSESEITSLTGAALRQLKLVSNRWKCDKNIMGLVKWLKAKEGSLVLRGTAQNVCGWPRNMVNRRLVSLKAEEVGNGEKGLRENETDNQIKNEIGDKKLIDKEKNDVSGMKKNKNNELVDQVVSEKIESQKIAGVEDEGVDKVKEADAVYFNRVSLLDLDNEQKESRKNLGSGPDKGNHRNDHKIEEVDNDKIVNAPYDSINELDFANDDDVRLAINKGDKFKNKNLNNFISNINENYVYSDALEEEEYRLMNSSFKVRNIAMVIIAVTAVIASIILFLIFLVCYYQRQNRRKQAAFSSHVGDQRTIKCKDKNGVLYFSTSSIDRRGEILPEQETLSDVGSVYKSSDVMAPMTLNYPESTVVVADDYDINNSCFISNKNFKIFTNNNNSPYSINANDNYNNNPYNNNNHSFNNDAKRVNSMHRLSLSNSVSKVNSFAHSNNNNNNKISNSNSFYSSKNFNNHSNSCTPATNCSVSPSKKTNTYRWEDI